MFVQMPAVYKITKRCTWKKKKKYEIEKSYHTEFCCNKMCLTLVLRAVTQLHQITQYCPICVDGYNRLQNNISAPRRPCNPAMLHSSTFNSFFFFFFNPERTCIASANSLLLGLL